MLRIFVCVCICFYCSACFESVPVQKTVLSEEKIRAVLKDIHLAESLLTEITNVKVKDSLARQYYEQIFFIHKIDSVQFNQTMHALFTDPLRLDTMYSEIIKDLGKEKKRLQK